MKRTVLRMLVFGLMCVSLVIGNVIVAKLTPGPLDIAFNAIFGTMVGGVLFCLPVFGWCLSCWIVDDLAKLNANDDTNEQSGSLGYE